MLVVPHEITPGDDVQEPRPDVDVNGGLVTRQQQGFQHSNPVVLEQDPVMLGRGDGVDLIQHTDSFCVFLEIVSALGLAQVRIFSPKPVLARRRENIESPRILEGFDAVRHAARNHDRVTRDRLEDVFAIQMAK